MKSPIIIIIIILIVFVVAAVFGYKYFLHQYVGTYIDEYVKYIPFIGEWLTQEGFGVSNSPSIANTSLHALPTQDKTMGSTRVMGHGNQCMWDTNKCNLWDNTPLGAMSNNDEYYKQQKYEDAEEEEKNRIYLESWKPTKKILFDKIYPPGSAINKALTTGRTDTKKRFEEIFKSTIDKTGIARGGDSIMIDIGSLKIE